MAQAFRSASLLNYNEYSPPPGAFLRQIFVFILAIPVRLYPRNPRQPSASRPPTKNCVLSASGSHGKILSTSPRNMATANTLSAGLPLWPCTELPVGSREVNKFSPWRAQRLQNLLFHLPRTTSGAPTPCINDLLLGLFKDGLGVSRRRLKRIRRIH